MKYNGWTNYETWLINLWLSDYLQEIIEELCISDISELENYIKDYLEETNPIKENGLFADLLNSILNNVNYREIAEHILEE